MVPAENLFWKRLVEDVSNLILGCHGMHSGALAHMGYEEVTPLVNVFCPETMLVGSKCSAMKGLGLAMNLTEKIFQSERPSPFLGSTNQ